MIDRTSLRTLLLLAVASAAFVSTAFAQTTQPIPGLGTNALSSTDPYSFTVNATVTPSSGTTTAKPTMAWIEVGALVGGVVPTNGWLKGPIHKITGTADAAYSDTFAHLIPGNPYWVRSSAQFGTALVVTSNHSEFFMITTTATLSVTPASTFVLAAAGASASLSVTATGDDISIQWLKGTVPVPGATGPTLSFPSVTAANAGVYTCKVTNPAPAPLVNTVTTNITLAVASISPFHPAGTPLEVGEGATITLTASITPADAKATYLWDEGLALSSLGATVTGQTTPTFTIKGALPKVGVSHLCKVTSSQPGNPSVNAFTYVDVNYKPVFDPIMFPPVVVSQDVGISIPRLTVGMAQMPAFGTKVTTATLTVKGLPAGLSLVNRVGDAGRHIMFATVTGHPTTPTPAGHPAMVTFTATNGWGSTTTTVPLTVMPLPSGVTGTHTAIFGPDPLNANLGGTASFTITATGAFSGSLLFGGTTIPITGLLVYDPTLTMTGSAHVTYKLPSAPTITAHATVAITFHTNNRTFALAITPDSGAPLYTPQGTAVQAQSNPDADPVSAAQVLGLHNFYTILPNSPPANTPEGASFGTLSIASDGTAAWTLSLADGSTKLTGSSPYGNSACSFYKLLYGGHGFVSGSLYLTTKAVTGTYDRVLGNLTWNKLGPASTTDHGYPSFSLSSIVAGSGHVVVPGNILWAPVTSPATLGVNLSFAGGGIGNATQAADFATLPAVIAATKTFTATVTPPATGINPKVTLTINNVTGAINGGFTLTDVVAGKTVLRNVTYQGLTSLFDGKAQGFFLLTPLPGTTGPTPLSSSVIMAP